jgi:ubiquinol-cytochrome c reductase cytochrome b subunit
LIISTLLIALLPACVPAAFAQTDNGEPALRLLNSQGCKACHRINETGAGIGPSLEKVGSRLSKEQLRDKLASPQKSHAAGRIADFSHLRDQELDALINFLSERK